MPGVTYYRISELVQGSGLDPEGLFKGALENEGLKRAVQAVSGGGGGEYERGWNPPLIGGEFGGAPPGFFFKNLCL